MNESTENPIKHLFSTYQNNLYEITIPASQNSHWKKSARRTKNNTALSAKLHNPSNNQGSNNTPHKSNAFGYRNV